MSNSIKRRKVTDTNVPPKPPFDLKQFRLTLLEEIGKADQFYSSGLRSMIFISGLRMREKSDFHKHSPDKSLENTRNRMMSELNNKRPYIPLRKIFVETFPSEVIIPSKKTIVSCLVSKFLELDDEYFKRKTEGENLKDINISEFQTVKICEILVPSEIIRHIVSFLEINSKILFSLGKVCKALYISILCSWPRIIVRKDNLFNISLLVYQNVREIEFCQNHSSNNFIQQELNFLVKNLSSGRLRKIIFNCFFQVFEKNVKFFLKFVKSNTNPFRNIIEVEFKQPLNKTSYIAAHNRLSKMVVDWKLDLRILFPCLRSMVNPLRLEVLNNLFLDKLSLSRFEARIERFSYFMGRNNEFVLRDIMEELLSSEKIKKFVNVEKLREFSIDYVIGMGKKHPAGFYDGQSFFSEVLEHFCEVKKLSLNIFTSYFVYESVDFNFEFLRKLKNIEELRICTFHGISDFRNYFPNTSITCFTSDCSLKEYEFMSLKNLKSLYLITRKNTDFEILFKGLEYLKKLESFYIVLGYCYFETGKFEKGMLETDRFSKTFPRIIKYLSNLKTMKNLHFEMNFHYGRRYIPGVPENSRYRSFTVLIEKNGIRNSLVFGSSQPFSSKRISEGSTFKNAKVTYGFEEKCEVLECIEKECLLHLTGNIDSIFVFSQEEYLEKGFDWERICGLLNCKEKEFEFLNPYYPNEFCRKKCKCLYLDCDFQTYIQQQCPGNVCCRRYYSRM